MSNEQMAQSILQFTGGKGNIRMVSNCMTRVRLEVNDPSVVQIDQIKALKGVFGVHVDAQVQVIVGPGTAAKVAACLQELLGDAHKAAGQADKEAAQEIAARNKQVIKGRQKVSKGKLFLKTISNVFVPLSSALIASGLLAGIVMFGLHHFMTPIHIELINQTGMTVLLPILAQAGAGQVGAALAIWLKCRKNKPLVGIVKGGLPSGILGIGEPLIYGVTLPLGKPFLTACLGAGVGGAFIASFGNVGATSQAVSGILMLPVIADQKWFIYAGGLLLSYAAGFVLTYFFGVPKEAEQPADTLEELEMQ